MREIKYRAWDNFKNRFVDNKQILKVCFARDKNIPNLVIYTDKVINCHIELKEKDKVYSTEFEVMQYTGLKDKNGKEIYEGDIVKMNFEYKNHFFEELDDLDEDVQVCTFDGLEFIYGQDNLKDVFSSACEVEVIGNIYENKELLGNENNGR